MTQENDSTFSLQALKKHYSIQEITAIFTDIDDRIMAMHDSSSKDFQMFNQQLRDFNTIAKQLSQNLQAIFDVTGKSGTNNEFSEFVKHYEELYDNISTTYTVLENIRDSGEQMLTYLQKIPLTIKNFSQDLMTLKFTLANIKLNFSGILFTNEDETAGILADVEKLTVQIKEDLPGLFKNTRSSNDLIEELKTVILDQSFYRITHSETILKQIYESIQELLTKNEQIGKSLPDIQSYIEKSFNSLDKIVTKIQYHDIIRQKMEHIQTTHQKLIHELSSLSENKEQQIVLFKQAKYVSQIPYIAEIQIAQLVYTNKEYQNAIEAITQTFNEIKKHMSASSELTQKLSQGKAFALENNYEKAKKELNKTAEVIYKLKKSYLDIIRIAETTDKRLADLGEHLGILKELDSKLQKLSANLSNEIYTNLQDKDLAKIGLEIKNLTGDLNSNIRNCELYYNYANQFNESIKEKLQSIKDREDIALAQKLCEHAYNVLEQVSATNKKAHERLHENTELSRSAHEKLKNTLDKMNYYDFFEQGMEDVIFELNNIYENLHQKQPDLSNLDKQEKLRRIKDFYTTKSERNVHDDILSGKDDKQTPQEKSENEDEDDDNIELF